MGRKRGKTTVIFLFCVKIQWILEIIRTWCIQVNKSRLLWFHRNNRIFVRIMMWKCNVILVWRCYKEEIDVFFFSFFQHHPFLKGPMFLVIMFCSSLLVQLNVEYKFLGYCLSSLVFIWSCMKGFLTAWGELFCFCPAARCYSLIGQPVTIRNMVEGGASHTADRGTTSVLYGAHAGMGAGNIQSKQGRDFLLKLWQAILTFKS